MVIEMDVESGTAVAKGAGITAFLSVNLQGAVPVSGDIEGGVIEVGRLHTRLENRSVEWRVVGNEVTSFEPGAQFGVEEFCEGFFFAGVFGMNPVHLDVVPVVSVFRWADQRVIRLGDLAVFHGDKSHGTG